MDSMIQEFSEHISDLVSLGKSLSLNENVIDLEKKGFDFSKDFAEGYYWRGADIQVVRCSPGDTKEKFLKSVVDVGYSIDDPCPSRYPELMSALINRIAEKADYLDGGNKYAFFDEIAKHACQIELNNFDLEKQTVCREIIFNQLRLVSSWRNNVIEENSQPTLVDLGWKVYFGYGRNANQEAMLSSRRCPDAQFMGPATLDDFEFTIDSKGYASVKKCVGKVVFGVLWAVSPEDFKRLDLREGVRKDIYRKENLYVNSLANPFLEKFEVVVYISNRPRGDKPQEGYIQEIIDGLSLAGISNDQIGYLNQFVEPKAAITKVSSISKTIIEEQKFLPRDISLPFFAYGLFNSSQIGYKRIEEYVDLAEPERVQECFLVERDGVPLMGFKSQLKEAPSGFLPNYMTVSGEKISFKPGTSAQAYNAIADLEPKHIYTWATIKIQEKMFNVLGGKKIFKGSQILGNESWDMLAHDPFIGELEDMIDNLLNDDQRRYKVIELQAAYIMVWTGIERLVTFSHSFKENSEKEIVGFLCRHPQIAKIFKDQKSKPDVFRDLYITSKPDKRIVFDLNSVDKCIQYLRQIRHNVVHRGKGGFADSELTEKALYLARQIFLFLYHS